MKKIFVRFVKKNSFVIHQILKNVGVLKYPKLINEKLNNCICKDCLIKISNLDY